MDYMVSISNIVRQRECFMCALCRLVLHIGAVQIPRAAAVRQGALASNDASQGSATTAQGEGQQSLTKRVQMWCYHASNGSNIVGPQIHCEAEYCRRVLYRSHV